jgi:cell filamentation protein, protein adenylyltransferase
MSNKLSKEYPHLLFRRHWYLRREDYFLFGQCDMLIKTLNNSPVKPADYIELMAVNLRKGAQATTAIEGNTLTDEEILKIEKGERLPPSKGYQETEVKNILDAFNELMQENREDQKGHLIDPELLKRLHHMVGKDLGAHFAARPGEFRSGSNNVTVGKYRAAEGVDVELLIDRFCRFLREEFRFEHSGHTYMDTIIEAIVAHVYLEWIHPFGDGNGRTGRLLEFYILLRGGLPEITLTILSNHYNMTRPEYYRQLQLGSGKRDLTEFIRYALVGLRDGMEQTLVSIQKSQFESAWREYIDDRLATAGFHKEVLNRRRTLALEIPLYDKVTFKQIPELSIPLARIYSAISEKTLQRDIEELINLHIIKVENGLYHADVAELNSMIAKIEQSVLFYNLHYVKYDNKEKYPHPIKST